MRRQIRGFALEGQVADLVDDDQSVALDPFELVVEGVAVLGGFEAVDPLLGGRERDAVAGLAGLDRQRDREVTLAGPGWSEEAHVGVLVGPGELREVPDQWLLGARLRAGDELRAPCGRAAFDATENLTLQPITIHQLSQRVD